MEPALPDRADLDAVSERLGWDLPYSDFIAGGKWDVDDVLRPIHEEAGEVMGREFPYPSDN